LHEYESDQPGEHDRPEEAPSARTYSPDVQVVSDRDLEDWRAWHDDEQAEQIGTDLGQVGDTFLVEILQLDGVQHVVVRVGSQIHSESNDQTDGNIGQYGTQRRDPNDLIHRDIVLLLVHPSRDHHQIRPGSQ